MNEEEYPKDEEYLDIHFPKEIYYKGVKKPESKLRGEAMVLLALAREEGKLEAKKEELEFWTNGKINSFSNSRLVFELNERIKQLQKEIGGIEE